MNAEDIVRVCFAIAVSLLAVAITVYYWQLAVPFWLAIIYAMHMKGTKLYKSISWSIFFVAAFVLFSQFPPPKIDTFCSWRDCPDAPEERNTYKP